jgi:hypothetical protein
MRRRRKRKQRDTRPPWTQPLPPPGTALESRLMGRALIATIIVTGAASLTLAVGDAEAKPYMTVPCYSAHGYGPGSYGPVLMQRPSHCDFNGDMAHAWQMNLRKMHWRSWGGKIACGSGEHFYNSGYRIKAKFCLYGKRRWAENTYTYTRIRGYTYGRWCAYDGDGYSCHYQKHRRYWRDTTW